MNKIIFFRSKKHHPRRERGAVLIMVLWALGLLTVFTVQLGIQVRQKVTLLSRLDRRAELRRTAASGVHWAKGIVAAHQEQFNENPILEKVFLHNNPDFFAQQPMGRSAFDISYMSYAQEILEGAPRYGLSDEEGRININTADRTMLARLIQMVLGVKQEDAARLASAIVDWREYGETEIVGFYSDEYYSNLEFPYPAKKADFEYLDELLLVKGITVEIYEKLLPFITVYGDGGVNVNTAPWAVLVAAGLSEPMANRIVFGRAGADGLEATDDDLVLREDILLGQLTQLIEGQEAEAALLQSMMVEGRIKAGSDHYRVRSVARYSSSEEISSVLCVFARNSGKIVYWRYY